MRLVGFTKSKAQSLLPSRSAHSTIPKGAGQRLYELACQLDLEGIVGKRATSPYGQNAKGEDGVKIKHPAYSQKEGRGDLFKRAG
jgi:ATP-dependent DNA ligase